MTASPLAQTPNDMFNAPIAEADPEIAEVLNAELSRQQNGLEMIASENFVPRAVLQAQGSVLTNKYAGRLSGDAATMVAASRLTRSKPLPVSVPRACLVPNTSTCSLTPAHRPMQPSTRRSSSRATPCSVLPSTMADISPTA